MIIGMRVAQVSQVVFSALLLGCSGQITGDPVNSEGAGGSSASPDPEVPAEACRSGAGLSPLRRLTRTEYDNTLRDLLGITGSVAAGFVPDEKLGAFDANVSSPVSELALEDYFGGASEIADLVASDPKRLAAVTPCDPLEAGCPRLFIETLGARAYRRPLAAAEVDRIAKVFAVGAANADFAAGARLAIQMMLTSPNFLYHLELGGTGAVRKLTPYEVAARLSYFVWGSMPDAALFQAARDGRLGTADEVEAEVRRMLGDDRSRAALRNFHAQWLGITKLLDPDQFDNPIGPAAVEEVGRVVDELLWSGEGKLPDLLTTRVSFVNPALSALYGIPGTAAAGFQRVELDARQRSGLLTRVATLAAHRTPTARGKFVRSELLCQHVPPPPPNVDTALPPVNPALPPRAQWEQHVADPSCGSCHRLMDPIGFGFENYDGLGKYRTMDGKWPVDATGELLGTAASDGTFTGALELSDRLAAAEELGSCATREMFVYALGRLADPAQDGCTLASVEKVFRASGYDQSALVVALARSDAFRARRVSP